MENEEREILGHIPRREKSLYRIGCVIPACEITASQNAAKDPEN